jgi:hypothetical protein
MCLLAVTAKLEATLSKLPESSSIFENNDNYLHASTLECGETQGRRKIQVSKRIACGLPTGLEFIGCSCLFCRLNPNRRCHLSTVGLLYPGKRASLPMIKMLMPTVQSYGIITQPKEITARSSKEIIIPSMEIERAMAEVSISLNTRIGRLSKRRQLRMLVVEF